MRLFLKIFLFTIIFSSLAFAFDISNDKIVLHYNNIVVEITTQNDMDNPYKIYDAWGSLDIIEADMITSLEIQVGESKVHVPLSVYMDLANPYEAKIKQDDKSSFIIEIKGGEKDTEFDYTAQIKVLSNKIISRTVRSGKLSKDRWERTKYSAF
jgi:hypothetical protein